MLADTVLEGNEVSSESRAPLLETHLLLRSWLRSSRRLDDVSVWMGTDEI